MTDSITLAIAIVLLLSVLGLWRETRPRALSGSIDGPDLSYLRLEEEGR